MKTRLNAVVAGCGSTGYAHAAILRSHLGFRLLGVSDRNPKLARAAGRYFRTKHYTSFSEMLEACCPDVAVICTPAGTQSALVVESAAAGLPAVICAKTVTSCYTEGRKVMETCANAGTTLITHLSRRLGSDLTLARQVIESKAIGEVRVLRGSCRGNTFEDGIHLIDSLLFLAGDPGIDWVAGQVVFHEPSTQNTVQVSPADSHAPLNGIPDIIPAESGAVGIMRLKNRIRIEAFTGNLAPNGWVDHEYRIEGTSGTLWRFGDHLTPDNLFIRDGHGGPLTIVQNRNGSTIVPAPNGIGEWRSLPPPPHPDELTAHSYTLLAETIRMETTHPAAGETWLQSLFAVSGIHQSARMGQRIHNLASLEQINEHASPGAI